MSSLIQKLYNGEVFPADEPMPEDSVYTERLHRVTSLQDTIKDLLPPEHQDLVCELSAAESLLSAPLEDYTFEQGFSLAIRLIISSLMQEK